MAIPPWLAAAVVLAGLALAAVGLPAASREGAGALLRSLLAPVGIALAVAGALLLAVPDFLVPRAAQTGVPAPATTAASPTPAPPPAP